LIVKHILNYQAPLPSVKPHPALVQEWETHCVRAPERAN
jgi:hypothetical protein